MITIASVEDFHAAVAATKEKPLVVFFSASWCGGCKMVAPKVATLAEELTASATFGKVSADELNALCDDVEVDSFPHFRVYKESKILGDYTGSKFDKVDAFIRGVIAPDTLQKVEETPECNDTTKEATTAKEHVVAETDNGPKKREREMMESNDAHAAKKTKMDGEAAGEAEKAEENAEETEHITEVADKTEEGEKVAIEAPETTNTSPDEVETTPVSSETMEKKPDESVFVDKINSNDAASTSLEVATS
ncbi:unnamed protein product [Peronospora belbahrii]|uniref:Thioredoxin domain-containing protein n=1 Tax=Peronospora belbahrii TaxID=622444 RepID=A0AAU9L3F6_9STRA|nr:unnamed protein product [Peronospora belbahrii]CAH0518700.1 unnamed protein product [Peronospora belbahrii]